VLKIAVVCGSCTCQLFARNECVEYAHSLFRIERDWLLDVQERAREGKVSHFLDTFYIRMSLFSPTNKNLIVLLGLKRKSFVFGKNSKPSSIVATSWISVLVRLFLLFVLGGAFGNIINSFVADILTPPIGLLTNGRNLNNWVVVLRPGESGKWQYNTPEEAAADGAVTENVGRFIQSIIYFFIVALALFWVIKGN
jgi:large conductance mechanosensitive channel protein